MSEVNRISSKLKGKVEAYFKECGFPEEVIKNLLIKFEANANDLISTMEKNFSEKNEIEAKNVCHALKGVLGNTGLMDEMKLVAHMEEGVKTKKPWDELIGQKVGLFERLCT